MDPGDVEYEPISVKAVLAEMKDTAELLIDLSYSAVLHGSDEVAAEVLELEERMDVLQMQARMSLLMAARSPEDAEALDVDCRSRASDGSPGRFGRRRRAVSGSVRGAPAGSGLRPRLSAGARPNRSNRRERVSQGGRSRW